MECIDLRTIGRYRVWNEAENRPARATDDPWDLIIPGAYGFVALWSECRDPATGQSSIKRLVAATNSAKMTTRILERVSGSVVVQDGDDGQNVTFAPDGFPAVAELLRLKKKSGWVQKGNGKIPAFIVGTATRQGVRPPSDDSQAT
jgi:hypothetical protein